MKITGQFEVTLTPIDMPIDGVDGISLGCMSIDKTFFGSLCASSRGQMLSALTPIKGSAGYVAIEQVEGRLDGRQGSFVLQHFGTMARGKDTLLVEVVPDSGTGGLLGLSGQMRIRIEDGKHYYDFDYELSQ